MATVYSTDFTGFSGNLQTNSPWSRLGANDWTCSGGAVQGAGSGERTYSDGSTPGTADASAQAVFTFGGSNQLGPMVRAVDINNWYWGYRNSNTGDWVIDQCSGGTITNLNTTFQGGQSSPFTLKLAVSTAQALTLYSAGTSRATATGSRSGTSGTGGLRGTNTGGCTLDDYISEDSSGGGGGGSELLPKLQLHGAFL